jgi:hypothetical protein
VLFALLWCVTVVYSQQPSPDLFVEAVVSNSEPYAGQQFTYTLRFYDAAGTTNALYSPADFEGFWRTDPNGQQQVIQHTDGRFYTVTDVTTALFPTQAGTVTISGAGVVLPATVFEDKRLLPAPAVEVRVRDLPDGAPEGFDGAVGQFALRVQADATSADVGEPVQVTVTVEGTGHVEGLPLPDVGDPSGWQQTVTDVQYHAAQQSNVLVGTKTFRVSFVSDQPGERRIPALRFVYFDPNEGVYQIVQSDEIPVMIRAAPQSEGGTTPVPAAVEQPALKAIATTMPPDAPSGLLWLVPAGMGLAGLGQRVWAKRRGIQEPQRRRERAFRTAKRRLVAASTPGTLDSLREGRQVLWDYGRMTDRPADWLLRLDEADPLRDCLARLDAALYAPESIVDVPLLLNQLISAFDHWNDRQDAS